jgi:hypothetical protein
MTKDRNMPSNRQGATAPMEKQDGIETRSQLETCSHAVGQGVELAVACLIGYALITQLLTRAALRRANSTGKPEMPFTFKSGDLKIDFDRPVARFPRRGSGRGT